MASRRPRKTALIILGLTSQSRCGQVVSLGRYPGSLGTPKTSSRRRSSVRRRVECQLAKSSETFTRVKASVASSRVSRQLSLGPSSSTLSPSPPSNILTTATPTQPIRATEYGTKAVILSISQHAHVTNSNNITNASVV